MAIAIFLGMEGLFENALQASIYEKNMNRVIKKIICNRIRRMLKSKIIIGRGGQAQLKKRLSSREYSSFSTVDTSRRRPTGLTVTVWERTAGICWWLDHCGQGRVWGVNINTPFGHLNNSVPQVLERMLVHQSSKTGYYTIRQEKETR